MAKEIVAEAADGRKALVQRIASSRYLNRSARLRDLLVYLVDRATDDPNADIREHEVGSQVFDRPANYDTATDNIVRVHASLLRKRLEQYFSSEGAHEPLILEISKRNYAPVFRTRNTDPVRLAQGSLPEEIPPEQRRQNHWPVWFLAGLAFLLGCSTLYLWLRSPGPAKSPRSVGAQPNVRLLWDRLFQPDRPTDIVVDDAALGLYQELTGHDLTLSSYYDRAYLRSLAETADAAHLNQEATSAMVLRRQTSFSGISFLWKLLRMPDLSLRPALLRFARDYSFRELKSNNALLLGNSRSNPWVEPFESKLGLRWMYDRSTGNYFPVDTWAEMRKYQAAGTSETREGYCAIALLPNLAQTGHVLIIAASGGSAMNAGADFLMDEQAVSALRKTLPSMAEKSFPYFEALIRVKGRGGLPRDAAIVVSRSPRK